MFSDLNLRFKSLNIFVGLMFTLRFSYLDVV